MTKTIYINFSDINPLQKDIMGYVDNWVHEKKKPVPLSKIIKQMEEAGIKNFTTVNAINSLLRKGYIRRAYTISNKTYFVQLRRA